LRIVSEDMKHQLLNLPVDLQLLFLQFMRLPLMDQHLNQILQQLQNRHLFIFQLHPLHQHIFPRNNQHHHLMFLHLRQHNLLLMHLQLTNFLV